MNWIIFQWIAGNRILCINKIQKKYATIYAHNNNKGDRNSNDCGQYVAPALSALNAACPPKLFYFP